MPETVIQPEASTEGLSQVQRLVDTFVAPSKTFTDIQRNSSWWLPWLIGVIITLGLGYAIQQKIGWEKTYQTMMRQSPKQMQRIEGLPADQQAGAMAMGANFTKIIFWATPLIALLVAVVAAAVLLATVNFGFGGTAKFSRIFAVWMYGTLPWAIQGLLGIITVCFGVDPDSFNLKNFVGTNIGYYMPTDWSPALIALGTALDITTIWSLILLTIGCAIVGNVKTGKAATAVFGWWVLIVLLKVGTASFS
jgi:hypothetical protein